MKINQIKLTSIIAIVLSISSMAISYANENTDINNTTQCKVEKNFTGWLKNNSGKLNYYKNGVMLTDTWIKNNEKNYFLDPFGNMVNDCEYYINGKYYVFNNKGEVYDKKGWIKRSTTDVSGNNVGYSYYGNGDKTVKTSTWFKDGGKKYYFNESGRMLSNIIQKIDNKFYIFDASGALINKNGWIKYNWNDGDGQGFTSWCYGNGDGTVVQNKWVKENNKLYYIKDNFRLSSTTINDKGKFYILDSNGSIIKKSGWIKINYSDGGYDSFYGNGDGTVKVNQWIKENGNSYHVDSRGYLDTNSVVGKTVTVKNKVATIGANTLELRKNPNDKYGEVYKTGINQVVKLKEKNNDGWYKVELPNGVTGWCKGQYLNQFRYFNETTLSELSQSEKEQKIDSVVSIVKNQIGKPYVWAAVGPNKFDCSGLMIYSYSQGAGISLSDYSAEQAVKGRYIPKNELKKGDLVFFDTMGKGRVSHVGMYVGDDNFVHASNPKDDVKISKLSENKFNSKYIGARRIIE